MKYDKFGKRLKQCLETINMDPTSLAKKLKVTRQAVNTWTSGKSVPGFDTLVELPKLLHTSLDYLMRGISYTSIIDSNGQNRALNVSLFPIFSTILFDPVTLTPQGHMKLGEYLYKDSLPETCLFYTMGFNNMSCSDISMSINKEDILIIDSGRKPRHGNIVLTINDDYSYGVYQYFEVEDEVRLHSFNPNFPDFNVDFSSVRGFIPIIEVIPRSRKLL